MPARERFRVTPFVIILGLMPLALASLGPYVTVGAFLAMLMTFSAPTTLLLLPALMRVVGLRFVKK